MPFIKLKKVETRNFGPHALNLKLPFGEIDVLEKNVELIKRQLRLEHIEILSASDEAALAKAGSHLSVLNKTPPSPGEPVAIFMSRQEFEAQY
jgi:leucyl-tRNA synthetase